MPIVPILIIICGFALFFALVYLAGEITRTKDKNIRSAVFNGGFISADRFEGDWIRGGLAGSYGLKYASLPGCYIILVFDSPVNGDDYSGYAHGYIGQSVDVCSRVHSHLNGKGQGDIYADRKAGKQLYVKIIGCQVSELNDLETRLIDTFDWNRLYNRRRGGGHRHGEIPDTKYSGNFESAIGDVLSGPPLTTIDSASVSQMAADYPATPMPNPAGCEPAASIDVDRLKSKAVGGDAVAQYELGAMYERGELVKEDYYYAAMWYRMAADSGHRLAAIRLATMYRDGRGVPEDRDTAIEMLERLATEGCQEAADMLKDMG